MNQIPAKIVQARMTAAQPTTLSRPPLARLLNRAAGPGGGRRATIPATSAIERSWTCTARRSSARGSGCARDSSSDHAYRLATLGPRAAISGRCHPARSAAILDSVGAERPAWALAVDRVGVACSTGSGAGRRSEQRTAAGVYA
jgi:hypothetical protein